MDLTFNGGDIDPTSFADQMAAKVNGHQNHHQTMNQQENGGGSIPATDEAPPTYADAFPPLPTTPSEHSPNSVSAVKWGKSEAKPVLKPAMSSLTQVFSVPYEEKRYKNFNSFGNGEMERQNSVIRDVMTKTNTTIEVCNAKDQSLTILVTGKKDNVAQAKRLVLNALQTQGEIQMQIPREHHKYILGKGGQRLKNLELQSTAKIKISKDSDVITITGTKEGIAMARHEIQIISDQQAKLAFERLPIPKIYHPFIIGPSNTTIENITKMTGAQINIPPPSVFKDELTVAGDKDSVLNAVQMITDIYEEKKRKCTTVSVEVSKPQHKYIKRPKGQGIQEIFALTGVSVEVPPEKSDQTTITLRGEPDKLGLALTQVYEKANSVVTVEVGAPKWLHRFIIGRDGQNIKKITHGSPKLHVEFSKEDSLVRLEGPPAEVEACQAAFQASINELKNTMDFAEFDVPQKWHRHIIGKSGVNITRIKNETGTAINFPPDGATSDTIRIEGSPAGVASAKTEILRMVAKMENEKSRDIMIDQKFHRLIIGAGGENITEIREKFHEVQIVFPDSNKKSDIVTIRGPKEEVDKCYQHLKKYTADVVASNYELNVPIIKKFHRNIIGKGGQNVKKIKEETDTNIRVPPESSPSNVIVITGYKAQVEKARDMILALQNELASIVNAELSIPNKYHTSMIGSKGRLIKSVMDECGDVHINFPSEGSGSDVISIRGVKEDVEKAKAQLLEILADVEKQAAEKQLYSFTGEVRAKPEYHRFLIGRGGANINKIRTTTGARIMFPTIDDPDKDVITIIGKEESVAAAKKELLEKIKDLDNVTEDTVSVDPKYHSHFTARKASVLKEIADEFGGVIISMPRDLKSTSVTLKGSAECVEGARQKILQIVEDLGSMVTIECVISQKHHRAIMGQRGRNVQDITTRNKVNIKFPDRAVANGNAGDGAAGESGPSVGEDSPRASSDVIMITGKAEDAENAKKELLELVPISEVMLIPFDYHRYIIGKSGAEVRSLMNEHSVNIAIPPTKDKSEEVVITGPQTNVDSCIVALKEKIHEIEAEMEDKRLRSYQMNIDVPIKYHTKIIGRKGAVVKKLRADYDVQIQVPDEKSGKSEIILTGYESNCHKARAAILEMINHLDSLVSVDVQIDHRIHNRIIGQRGKNVRKIMEDFNVDIRFPRDPNEDIVTITGSEDAVEDCEEHLLMLEEEYIDDVQERHETRNMMAEYFQKPSGAGNKKDKGSPDSNPAMGYVVRDAPWSAGGGERQPQGKAVPNQAAAAQAIPDSANQSDFPTLGAAPGAKKEATSWGAWGRK
eukprot:gene15058-16611_t